MAHRAPQPKCLRLPVREQLPRRRNAAPIAWIDPNFGDVGVEGNDDHPPVDLRCGQQLVRRVYQAVATAGQGLWRKTLLIIIYGEHGGFFDHVAPGAAADDLPAFQRYGVRVPALVVSPWVDRGFRHASGSITRPC